MKPATLYPNTANEWMARLEAADCSQAEREAFERWRASSSANRAAFARYENLCKLPRELASNAELFAELVAEVETTTGDESARADISPGIAVRPFRHRWQVGIALAASLACIAIAGGWYLSRDTGAVPEYAAPASEQRTVTLADGSVVTLNMRSGISTSFTAKERRVMLSAGEAFFVVTKDSSRPFIVSTGQSEIRVVGTQFAVRQNKSVVEVIVREGKVEVVPDASRPSTADGAPVKVALAAGKRLQFEPKPGRLDIAAVDAERLTSWRHGSVEFDGSTLDEVIEEMNRHFDTPLVLDDEALRSHRISGRFRVGDSESFAASLAERFDLQQFRQANAIHLRH